MSSEVVITAVSVYPPDKTPYVNLYDETGRRWGVYKDRASSIVQNGTYRVLEYDTKEIAGKTYYTIKRFETITNAPAPKTNGAAPASAAVVPSRRVEDNTTRMDIFICGAMNNLLSNPNSNPMDMQLMDIVERLQTFKQAWLAVFGPAPIVVKKPDPISTTQRPPVDNSDMGDESIPF